MSLGKTPATFQHSPLQLVFQYHFLLTTLKDFFFRYLISTCPAWRAAMKELQMKRAGAASFVRAVDAGATGKRGRGLTAIF